MSMRCTQNNHVLVIYFRLDCQSPYKPMKPSTNTWHDGRRGYLGAVYNSLLHPSLPTHRTRSSSVISIWTRLPTTTPLTWHPRARELSRVNRLPKTLGTSPWPVASQGLPASTYEGKKKRRLIDPSSIKDV